MKFTYLCLKFVLRPIGMKRLLRITLHIFAFVAIALLSSVGITLIARSMGISTADNDLGFAVVNVAISLTLLILLSLYERVACGDLPSVGWRGAGFNPTKVLMGVVLLVAASVATSPLAEWLDNDIRSFPDGEWTLVVAVVVAPILEELIFRGRLISIFRREMPLSVAVVLSSLIFAAAHGSFVVALDAFIAGLILSYFYLSSRSIIMPIILHICNNAVAYSLTVLSYRGEDIADIFSSSASFLIVYAISLVIVALGFGNIIRFFFKIDTTHKDDLAKEIEAEQ